MSTSEQEQRHQSRMQRKKAVVDAAITRADREQGLSGKPKIWPALPNRFIDRS